MVAEVIGELSARRYGNDYRRAESSPRINIYFSKNSQQINPFVQNPTFSLQSSRFPWMSGRICALIHMRPLQSSAVCVAEAFNESLTGSGRPEGQDSFIHRCPLIADFPKNSMAIRDKIGSITEPWRARQHFTNRKNPIRHFACYLNDNPATEKILFFHGDGGNGKTLLLRFLKEKCCKRLNAEDWEYVKSLEGDNFIENFAGAIDCAEVPSTLIDFGMEPRGAYRPKEAFSALMRMRRDLSASGLRFPLYDFACTLYLHKTGQLTPDRQKDLFPSEEMDLVNETIDIIKEVPGVGLAKGALGLFNKRMREKFTLYMSARKIDEEDVLELKSMDPDSELYGLFPYLFAKDLNASMTLQEAPQRVVLFFDTHEAFWEVYGRKFSDEKYFLGDEWLRRLLSTLERGRGIIAVVAGREEPRWAEATRANIPAQHIDTHLVGGLSFADSALYLEKVEILDRKMQESLLAYAQIKPDEVHPLYLGLCADIVLAAKRSGREITAEEFREIPDTALKGKELMSFLRKYVDRPTEYAISALSACRSFDRDLYVSLIDGLKPDFSREGFDYLTEFSFVWDSEDRGEGWYRVHDLMRRLAYEQKDPTTVEAHQFLTQYYHSRGEQGDITAIAERVYHANRLDSEVGVNQWLTEMDLALISSKYEVCRALLGIRNELFLPDNFSRGRVSMQEGEYYATLSIHQNALIEYQEAIEAFDEALRIGPDDVAAHNNRGVALQRLGELQAKLWQHDEASKSYARAIRAFDEALRIAPDHVAYHNNKGNALVNLGKLQAGLSRHDEASKSHAKAIEAYNEALRLAPDNAPAHNNKGSTLQSLGELQAELSRHDEASKSYARAIEAFDEALRIAPDDAVVHNNRGNALRTLGDLQARLSRHDEASKSHAQAIEAYDEALRLAPDHVAANINKGSALRTLGDLQAGLLKHDEAWESYDQAIKAFDEALRVAPDYVLAHNNKGSALQSVGKLQAGLYKQDEASKSYARAIEAYNEALRLAPDYAPAHNNKGNALRKLGDLHAGLSKQDEASKSYARAIEAFDEALHIAPEVVQFHNNKGNALASLGKLQAGLSSHDEASKSYAQAIATYDEALRLAPDYAPAHNNKGNTLRNLGELKAGLSRHDEASKSYAQAIEAFDEALRIAPYYVAAHNNKGIAMVRLWDLLAGLSRYDEALQYIQLAVAVYSRSLEIAPAQENIRKLRDSIQQILDKKRIS